MKLYFVRFFTIFFLNLKKKTAIPLKLENCSTSMAKVLTISLSWIHHLVLANKALHNWRKRLLLLLMVMYVVWINVMIKVFFEKQAYKMIYYLNKKKYHWSFMHISLAYKYKIEIVIFLFCIYHYNENSWSWSFYVLFLNHVKTFTWSYKEMFTASLLQTASCRIIMTDRSLLIQGQHVCNCYHCLFVCLFRIL